MGLLFDAPLSNGADHEAPRRPKLSRHPVPSHRPTSRREVAREDETVLSDHDAWCIVGDCQTANRNQMVDGGTNQ